MKRLISLLCIAVLVLTLFAGGTMVNAVENSVTIDPDLTEILETESGPYQVIVTFHGDGGVTNNQLGLLEELGIETGVAMQSLPIVGLLATKNQIDQLADRSEVRSIYLNKELEYYNADATEITGVDKARTDADMTAENGGMPISGEGIGVVVNDSGVDGTHKDHELGRNLVQNVAGSTNLNSLAPGLLPVSYTENVPNTDTNSGHGTHVAGTVGGTGAMSGGLYEGAAPGADLIGYGSGAALFVLDTIGGFDYAITHQNEYNIRVITNSWGSSGDFDPENPVNIASKKTYDRGITVLFAAGNEGPGENTHNPYAKAPWVISVGAGEKDGKLADFSSRGTKSVGGTFELDGKTWTWKDQPTITAPGVDIISTRVIAPVSSLAIDSDLEEIDPAHVPYYTMMSGTSMATPHVAGVVALMLEADPTLSPDEVKEIIEQTATNMPGYEPWEVGAGYLNAYAAVDSILFNKDFGKTVNAKRTFHSEVESMTEREAFTVDYNPLTYVSDNHYEFEVEEGLSGLTAKVNGKGLLEETGNPINLVLIAPDGTEYSSGISLLFTLYTDRTVTVNSPQAGTWKAEVRGLKGDDLNPTDGLGLPEEVEGTLAYTKVDGYTGLEDIAAHPAAGAIQMGINERLFDGYADGEFKPDQELVRSELAEYLVMGAEIRQSLPFEGASFVDVDESDRPFVEAVTADGAAFMDFKHQYDGVMLSKADGFAPDDRVTREELAYSLVQSLGLQDEAQSFSDNVTVEYKGERIEVVDANEISDSMKGYVQYALDLNIINASYEVTQGKYDLEPTVKAYFTPNEEVTRGDFAVAMTRYYNAYHQ
ncbi:serine protease AprX [Thalassobacillus cyri]|uniref:Serine protease AprX n=1 Tax=Thalassobacillus cyri TaxID=571932 RepID=A0A1H3YTF3_9BACI|nr:S8 family serine peptidase [Thalassobacillus cyri]SEA14826.1 serine protease AprX [Thalassobacillus cyri]